MRFEATGAPRMRPGALLSLHFNFTFLGLERQQENTLAFKSKNRQPLNYNMCGQKESIVEVLIMCEHAWFISLHKISIIRGTSVLKTLISVAAYETKKVKTHYSVKLSEYLMRKKWTVHFWNRSEKNSPPDVTKPN